MGKKKSRSGEDTDASKRGVLLEKAEKEFDDSDVEALRLYFELNNKKQKPLSQAKCFEGFAIEHGFTRGQVKGQYFTKIYNKQSQQQASDKEMMKQAHQDMLSEVLEKEMKKKRKRNESSEDDETSSDESQSDDDMPPSKHGKKEEVGTFKPFKFESSTGRFYLYRYPTHYKFKLQISQKKHFEIDVLVDTKVTVDQLKLRLGESVIGPNLVSEGDRDEKDSFIICEKVRGDVEMKTIKGGPVRIGEERWYMVFIEKKQRAVVQVDDFEWGGIGEQEGLVGSSAFSPIKIRTVKETQDTLERKENE